MIKSRRQYKELKKQLAKETATFDRQVAALHESGYSDEKMAELEQAHYTATREIQQAVDWYEQVQERRVNSCDFGEIGRFLVALRISEGLSQTELAKRMGWLTPQVSRYETTFYESASIGRVRQVLKALGAGLVCYRAVAEEEEGE